jgi:hypothetical protein
MTIGFRDRLKSKGNSDPLFKGPSIAGYLITVRLWSLVSILWRGSERPMITVPSVGRADSLPTS